MKPQWKAGAPADGARSNRSPCTRRSSTKSFASFAIAAFLIFHFHGKKRYDGQVFLAFVGALFGACASRIEFVRADDRGGFLGLSTSQLVGILLIGGVVWLHKRLEARSDERFSRHRRVRRPPSRRPPLRPPEERC